jgi:hypothetical protein
MTYPDAPDAIRRDRSMILSRCEGSYINKIRAPDYQNDFLSNDMRSSIDSDVRWG